LTVRDDGKLELLERIEGGRHQVAVCDGPPMVVGWATGHLPEPKNNPQIGMQNMRQVMPALQRAATAAVKNEGLTFAEVTLPSQLRETRVVKDQSPDDIAREIVDWLKE
jgi:electron transfer flavoprotein beta subunit